jgi:hypothetical protein
MKRKSVDLPLENVLQIDKDCRVSGELELLYIRDSVLTLARHGIRVLLVRAKQSCHFRHYYFHITPAVDTQTANDLQFLLGDDAKRVAYNQARINSGLKEWNRLFEPVFKGRVIRYSNPANHLTTRSERRKTCRS